MRYRHVRAVPNQCRILGHENGMLLFKASLDRRRNDGKAFRRKIFVKNLIHHNNWTVDLVNEAFILSSKPQRREKPPILSRLVSILQRFLHLLLCFLPLTDLLERIVADHTLQPLQLKRISRRHQMVVVDHLDKRLDLTSLLYPFLAHATGYFGRVSLDACDEGVGEGMCFGAGIDRLDYDDLEVENFCSVKSRTWVTSSFSSSSSFFSSPGVRFLIKLLDEQKDRVCIILSCRHIVRE